MYYISYIYFKLQHFVKMISTAVERRRIKKLRDARDRCICLKGHWNDRV